MTTKRINVNIDRIHTLIYDMMNTTRYKNVKEDKNGKTNSPGKKERNNHP